MKKIYILSLFIIVILFWQFLSLNKICLGQDKKHNNDIRMLRKKNHLKKVFLKNNLSLDPNLKVEIHSADYINDKVFDAFKNNDDNKINKVFLKLKNRHSFGKIKKNNNNQELWYKEKKIFSATTIKNYSKSNNNIIAISGQTGIIKNFIKIPSECDYKINDGSYFEVWIIDPKKTFKLSSYNLNATNPLISNNGRYISFSTKKIDGFNCLGESELYIVDLQTKKYVIIKKNNNLPYFFIIPLIWDRDDKILRILIQYGEFASNDILNIEIID